VVCARRAQPALPRRPGRGGWRRREGSCRTPARPARVGEHHPARPGRRRLIHPGGRCGRCGRRRRGGGVAAAAAAAAAGRGGGAGATHRLTAGRRRRRRRRAQVERRCRLAGAQGEEDCGCSSALTLPRHPLPTATGLSQPAGESPSLCVRAGGRARAMLARVANVWQEAHGTCCR
jgi:hypothetical protein